MFCLLVADSDSSESEPSSEDACVYYELLDEYMTDIEAQPPIPLVRLDRPAPVEPGRQEPAPGPPRPDLQRVDVNNHDQPADGGSSRPRRRWVQRLLQPFCIRD